MVFKRYAGEIEMCCHCMPELKADISKRENILIYNLVQLKDKSKPAFMCDKVRERF